MEKSRGHRGLMAAAGLVSLMLLSGPALAEGADAAPNPERDARGRPLRNNPQTPPIQRQVRPEDQQRQVRPDDQQRDRDAYRQRRESREQQRGSEERARTEQHLREQREAEQRAREQRVVEERRRNEERAREQRFGDRRDDGRRDDWRRDDWRRDRDWRDRDGHPPRWVDRRWYGPTYAAPYGRYVWVGGRPFEVRPDRRRVYRNVVVLRPYGPWYYGYGRYYRDVDAYRWLGLTAITFAMINYLNEPQLRALEDAQIAATTAPVGAPIMWTDSGAQGTVVATRDGWSDSGLYCREFQQTVEMGGRVEQAYGTACQQPDGAWQVTSQ